VFVAWFVALLLLQIRALSRGPEAYAEFERWLQNPLVLLVNLITLLFVVFHAVTWFNLAPSAMAVRFRGKRVPDIFFVGSNFSVWDAVSVVLACFFVRG